MVRTLLTNQYRDSPDGKFTNITVNMIGMIIIIWRWVGSPVLGVICFLQPATPPPQPH